MAMSGNMDAEAFLEKQRTVEQLEARFTGFFAAGIDEAKRPEFEEWQRAYMHAVRELAFVATSLTFMSLHEALSTKVAALKTRQDAIGGRQKTHDEQIRELQVDLDSLRMLAERTQTNVENLFRAKEAGGT